MYLKTDKENAKLNSQCEKDGTISPSPQDTFREDSISVLSFLLACIIFHWRVQRKPESLLLFLIFFFFFSMWHKFFFYYYYFPANVKAVPISLVCFWHLAVINNASHWITSFIYSASVISLISSPPSPVYLSGLEPSGFQTHCISPKDTYFYSDISHFCLLASVSIIPWQNSCV